ncbi:MAG: NADAR family protein [Nitrospirota bacterium]
MTIYFFGPESEYGYLSNFSDHGIEMDGRYWRTVEHYYQAQKFIAGNIQEGIRSAKGPDKAKMIARNYKEHINVHWDDIKDEVMFTAVLKKFQTHEDLRALLVATGDNELVENSPGDFYWGCGWNRTGQNKLGKILMKVRARFKP